MRLPEALPQISGVWLVIYRVVWAVVALLALYSVTWGLWTSYQQRASADAAVAVVGLGLEPAVGGYMVRPLTDEVRDAGVADYDELTAIDGQPASLLSENVASSIARLSGPDGQPVTLTLVAQEGERKTVTLERSARYLAEAEAGAPMPQAQRTLLSTVGASLIGIMAVLVSLILFRRRPGDPVAALLSLAFALFIASEAWGTLPVGGLALGLNMGMTIVAAVCLLLGLLVFPAGRFDTRLAWIGLGLIALALGCHLSGLGAGGVGMALWLLALAGCAAAVVRRYFKLPPGPQRQQMKWSLLGVVAYVFLLIVSLGIGMVQSAVTDPAATVVILLAVEAIDVAGTLALMGGFLVSLLRHRLYDADAAISRSVSVGAVTLAAVGVFAAAEKLVEMVGEQVLGAGAASAVAAALAAVVVLPLHNWLSAWTEARFQKSLTRLKADLPEDLSDLRATETAPAIALEASERVREAVQARRAAVLAASGDDWTLIGGDEDDTDWRPGDEERDVVVARDDLAYPVRVRLPETRGRTAGWLLIGPRPDGTPIGKDEREAVSEVAGAIGRALSSAARRSAQTQGLLDRIARLEAGRRAAKRS